MTKRKPTVGHDGSQPVEHDLQSPASSKGNSQAKTRPNVLLVMADQHRRTCIGAAGDSVARTPNLDRLAEQSVRFTNAFCTNPVCAPSRASMLTGLFSHRLDSTGNDQPFAPQHKTVAEYFSRADYLTALIGKMHLVDAQLHGFQYELEFNDWLSVIGPRAALYANETLYPNSGAGLPQIQGLWNKRGDPWKDVRKHDGRLGYVAVGRPSEMDEEDHFESFVRDETIDFLEKHGNGQEPFFLVTSFLKPHDPFMPAKRFAGMFDAKDMPLPSSWGKADLDNLPATVAHEIKSSSVTPELLEASAARTRIASYYGNLAQTDECVGQVLEALKRLGLDDNTIVIYTSDHGEMLGDLGLWNKFMFYENSLGVPLMFRVPGHKPGVCETPVSLVSLAATIGEMCSVPLPGPSDGKSFAALIKHPSRDHDDGPIFAEYGRGGPQEKYLIRLGKLKYSFWLHESDELYDLHKDPDELVNLIKRPEYRETAARLQKRLFEWYRPDMSHTTQSA